VPPCDSRLPVPYKLLATERRAAHFAWAYANSSGINLSSP